jgi:hypothetical protein
VKSFRNDDGGKGTANAAVHLGCGFAGDAMLQCCSKPKPHRWAVYPTNYFLESSLRFGSRVICSLQRSGEVMSRR